MLPGPRDSGMARSQGDGGGEASDGSVSIYILYITMRPHMKACSGVLFYKLSVQARVAGLRHDIWGMAGENMAYHKMKSSRNHESENMAWRNEEKERKKRKPAGMKTSYRKAVHYERKEERKENHDVKISLLYSKHSNGRKKKVKRRHMERSC